MNQICNIIYPSGHRRLTPSKAKSMAKKFV